MKSETDIKPTLLTPEMVAQMWSISVKKVYEMVNQGALPYVLMPKPKDSHDRKRLIRIRAAVVES